MEEMQQNILQAGVRHCASTSCGAAETQPTTQLQQQVEEMVERETTLRPEVKKRYDFLLKSWEHITHIQGLCGGQKLTANLVDNPARKASVKAKTDAASIAARLCFLCRHNRPPQQECVCWRGYDICFNPFPGFLKHLTIIDAEHTPQDVTERFADLLDLTGELPSFYLLYNGAKCGASAPDHRHFQAAAKETPFCTPFDEQLRRGVKGEQHVVACATRPVTAVWLSSLSKGWMEQAFAHLLKKGLEWKADFADLINILAWSEGAETSPAGGRRWHCIVFLRGKHRPEAFFLKGKEHMPISPGIAEMAGIIPVLTPADKKKITPEALCGIYNEVSVDVKKALELTRELKEKML